MPLPMPMPMPMAISGSRLKPTSRGFPTSSQLQRKPAVHGNYNNNNDDDDTINDKGSNASSNDKRIIDNIFVESINKDDEYNNASIIMSWSQKELQMAMAEVSSLISVKNIEALKKMAIAQKNISTKNNEQEISMKSNEEKIHHHHYQDHQKETPSSQLFSLSQSEEGGLAFLVDDGNEDIGGSKVSTKKIHIMTKPKNDISSTVNESATPHYIAASYEELKQRQKEVSAATRATFAWTLDEDVKENGKETEGEKELKRDAVMSQFTLSRVKHDRFDLDGRRVIKSEDIKDDIRESIKDNPLFLKSLSTEGLDRIVSYLIERMLSADIVVEHTSSSQPQDELLNHEFDRDKPGYTFKEISEMFRSEVPSQRLVAMKMYNGILTVRDDIVSSECMGYEGGDKPLGDGEGLSDRSSLSCRYRRAYRDMLDYTMKVLSEEGVFDDHKDPLFFLQTVKKVRRVLTFSLLFFCAADLPTDLPILLLWALGMHFSKIGTLRLATLECIRKFISSVAEEQVAGGRGQDPWDYRAARCYQSLTREGLRIRTRATWLPADGTS